MLTLSDGRNELWQWDTGRKLAVDAECSQVHFSNKVFGRSIDVDVLDGLATIPDILLQTDKELTAWAFVGTPENGYTKISKVFKVNKRNKPADYVFTPPEQTTLGEILERLDDIESAQDPDAIKNAIADYLEQNPVEAPVQSVNGKTGEIQLTADDVGAISQDDLQEATDNALAKAKESGEFDGQNGEPGKDGVTPHIGANGNWYIGEIDTGVKAQGKDGEDYVLTEDDKQEIAEQAAGLVEVPEAPEVSMQPLTFTGAVNATYDGSEALSVEIPSGGSGEWVATDTITLEEDVREARIDFDRTSEICVTYVGDLDNINNDSTTYTCGLTVSINGVGWHNFTANVGRASGVHENQIRCHVVVPCDNLVIWTIIERTANVSAHGVAGCNNAKLYRLTFVPNTADHYFKAGGTFTVYKR